MLGFASEFKIREFERQGLLRSVRGPMRAAFYARAELLALKARLALSEPDRASTEEWSDADLIALLEHPTRSGLPRSILDLVMETQISIERAERVYAFWAGAQGPGPRAVDGKRAHHARSRAPTPEQSRERRGEGRLARDGLIHELRDPDPRVREQAFERLRERRPTPGRYRYQPWSHWNDVAEIDLEFLAGHRAVLGAQGVVARAVERELLEVGLNLRHRLGETLDVFAGQEEHGGRAWPRAPSRRSADP